jgi:hypothetical protein
MGNGEWGIGNGNGNVLINKGVGVVLLSNYFLFPFPS